MPDPLAVVQDVADIWRPISEDEQPQVANLIEKASARLRQKCPFSVDDRIALFSTTPTDPTALDPVIVADLVATIVRRVLVNPDAAISVSQTAGPFSQSTVYGSRTSAARVQAGGAAPTTSAQVQVSTLQIFDSDIDQLRPAAPSNAVPSSFSYAIPQPAILIPGDQLGGVPGVIPDQIQGDEGAL